MLEYAANFTRAQSSEVSLTKCVYPAVGLRIGDVLGLRTAQLRPNFLDY